ncbi:MAG: hypothetical protein JST81_04495 [Bacteroidetes bacterium]|nr:hypothetical protein [Bacteroidota bacterium]
MKKILSLVLLLIFSVALHAQQKHPDISKPDPSKKIETVEASCGKCQFHLKGKSCELAVRINGKSYYVDGADINSFGDAHSKDGFCESVRKAEVQGKIVNGRYKVSYFKLLPSN